MKKLYTMFGSVPKFPEPRDLLKYHIRNIQSILDYTKEWEGTHPVFHYIRALIMKIQSYQFEYDIYYQGKTLRGSSYNEYPDSSMYERFFYGGYEKAHREIQSRTGEKVDSAFNINDLPLITGLWNNHMAENISKIGKNVGNPFQDNLNVSNHYYFPLGVMVSFGGNHSQFVAMLKGEGQVGFRTFYDISNLYELIYFDGNQFRFTDNKKTVNVSRETQVEIKQHRDVYCLCGILFEIGRALKDRLDIFPNVIVEQMNQLENENRITEKELQDYREALFERLVGYGYNGEFTMEIIHKGHITKGKRTFSVTHRNGDKEVYQVNLRKYGGSSDQTICLYD
ncbi:DUF6710 family protein [Listeria booriae]|uniref:DUF6710 family protein n=1 Tax=Listeria booriae TaxID=1552123 RepID=UPI0016232E0F|nr:DUF6710 family protein [Listeria booriae]MBC1983160.1 hypothetical protein [Listeria booriae]